MTVLIISSPSDVHYQAVDWALRQIGVETSLLFGNSFPVETRQTAHFTKNGLASYRHVDAQGTSSSIIDAQIVWYRRSTWPTVSATISSADVDAALREAEMFVGGMRSSSARHQRWINDPDLEAIADRKPYQLHVATEVGLRVPETLMTNDSDDARTFINRFDGGVILKPFYTHFWDGPEASYNSFATRISASDIPDFSAFNLTAHILQEYVRKSFEVRVLYLGGRLLSYRLHSGTPADEVVDWRTSKDGSINPIQLDLPEAVARSIQQYMDRMGLEYGALDFVVDPDGNYVFLECNVSGQFLFLENWNETNRVLAAFVSFLTNGLDLGDDARDKIDNLRFADFLRSGARELTYKDQQRAYATQARSRNMHYDPL